MNGRHDVFLSYRHDDSWFVDRLAKSLKKRGIQPWVDRKAPRNINGWHDRIIEALQDCHAVVAIISYSTTLNQTWVQSECAYASKLNKHILPVLISERVSPPHWLPRKSLSPISLVQTTGNGMRESGIDELADQIHSLPPPAPANLPYTPLRIIIAQHDADRARRMIELVSREGRMLGLQKTGNDEYSLRIELVDNSSNLGRVLAAYEQNLTPALLWAERELGVYSSSSIMDDLVGWVALQRGIYAGGIPVILSGDNPKMMDELIASRKRPNLYVIENHRDRKVFENVVHKVILSLMLSQSQVVPGFRLFYRG